MEETVQKPKGNVSDVVVIGTGPAALRFYQKLNKKKRQRCNIVGFIGAETIMNTMEGMGIVGPKNDSGSHEVIMTIEEFDIFYHLYKKGDITIKI